MMSWHDFEFYLCLNKLCLCYLAYVNVHRLHVKCFIIEEYMSFGISDTSLVDSKQS